MTHTSCRICGSSNLISYLDLGMMPLANAYANTKEEAMQSKRYPLVVAFCPECSLSQLTEVIDPKILYSNYSYRSGVNAGYVAHVEKMAKDLKERLNLNEDSFCIDIAGNDGTLRHAFIQEIGCKVLNVDPAANLNIERGERATDKRYRSSTNFWGMDEAMQLCKLGWPKADLITATNVFAHVDNVREFIEAAKLVLADKGQLVLEFPYLVDFIHNKEFDTVYFEHLSYWGITPLNRLINECGMYIHRVELQPIHGGSVRVSICHNENKLYSDGSVPLAIANEDLMGLNDVATYHSFMEACGKANESLRTCLDELLKKGNVIAAFGASAKGNTLLNIYPNGKSPYIFYIVDETPEKIGKYSAGTGIPIVPLSTLIQKPLDYLLILSWNFKDEIMSKCRANGYAGKFIIPVPEVVIL